MKTLTIHIPDRSELESSLGLRTPLAEWLTGDAPLVHLWLEHALAHEYGEVTFLCAPGSHLDLTLVNEFARWPFTVNVTRQAGDTPPDAVSIDSYAQKIPVPEHLSGWDLIHHHWELSRERMAHLWTHFVPLCAGVEMGRQSQIHPDAQLEPPFWIGDHCTIGAGARIGPYSVIGARSVIGAGASIRSTSIGASTWIGENARFEGYFIHEGQVLNRLLQIRQQTVAPYLVSRLDAVLPGAEPLLEAA